MPKKDKIQHLNIFLIKAGYNEYGDTLKTPVPADGFEELEGQNFEASLHVPAADAKDPTWTAFLKTGFGNDLDIQQNRLASALLFVRAKNRIFAITFGHARSLLLPESYERDFGLRVVVNRVDPNKIRSLSLKMFKELAVKRHEEAAKGTELRTFGVNVRRDLLRAVTGRPEDEDFAARLSGADSLAIDVPLKFSDLGDKCAELLKAYKEKLDDRFKWIENLKAVRDPALINNLDQLLLTALQGNGDEIQLMTPDSFLRDEIIGFRYSDETGQDEIHPELEIEDWRQSVGANLNQLTVAALRQRKIRGYDAQNQSTDDSEYLFFTFEAKYKKKNYVLSSGEWFEVSKELIDEIATYLKGITRTAIQLPDANANEIEEDYIARVDGNNARIMSYHTHNFVIDGSQIEPCDMLSNRGHLIHVKCWTASATFSHLLRQGAVSAEAILRFPAARQHVRDNAAKHAATIAGLFPANGFRPNLLTVVFALIRETDKELPFFSRLSLMREAEQIKNLGYQVVYQRIEVQ